jgi:P-type Ca2+ transporter type 2C
LQKRIGGKRALVEEKMNKGLTSTEAQSRLASHGYNELPSVKPKSIWRIGLEVLKEPMFLLLIASGSLYMILGDFSEGIILLSTILVIVFITFYQHQKTEKALEALKRLSSPRALVVRDGQEVRIPGREVVPGDVILLNEGDRIAADANLLDTAHLTIDESMLTGESIPVTKSISPDPSHPSNLLFSGTLVVQGSGRALVTSTGAATQFGKIGATLQSIKQDQTRLQLEMKGLIRSLFFIGGVLSMGVVVAFYFTRGNFIQSLLNGLSAAMAILPEEFPVVLTVFLALGAWRLSKIKVLTRNPSVIETLGSATVLCSDKTGTITQNKMAISMLYDGKETFSSESFASKKPELAGLINTAQRASQKDSVDPMEKAIANAFATVVSPQSDEGILLKEYPLSKDLFAMTRVLESRADKSVSVSAKGASEVILSLCKLGADEVARHMLAVNQMATKGYRVIGVASARKNYKVLPERQNDFDFGFVGLLGFEDPIRPEVPASIRECREAGIKVIMITGDYPATAKSIAAQIGLSSEGVITGDQFSKMSDAEIKDQIGHTTIFARVAPEQKLKIVNALKANNEIVAMTGDGVNDAPALKAAHIGIAMGKRGTDVAREASSLVLLDDNFTSIVAAVRSGRRIFDNLQKAMSYIIAIHIPIIGLTLLPAFFTGFPILLMPLHIVFMELIIDPVCSVAFEYEQEESGIMKRAPRSPEEKFFGGRKIAYSIGQGLMLLLVVLVVYFLSMNEGHSEGEVRAIAFSALIIGNIFLILTDLSKTRSFLSVFTERNYAVLFIGSAAIGILILINSVPSLQKLFGFEFPGYAHLIPSLAAAGGLLLVFEVIKFLKARKKT